MHSLKNEKLYYTICDELDKLYDMEMEERAKLPKLERPVLSTRAPNMKQLHIYQFYLSKYETELKEYRKVKERLDGNRLWQQLINSYVFECYKLSLVPIGLVERFIFNKYKGRKYSEIFQEYIQMLDWFESENIYVAENSLKAINNDCINRRRMV